MQSVELVGLLQAEGVRATVAPDADSLRFITLDAWKSMGCAICDAEEGAYEIAGDSAESAAERILTALHVSDMRGLTVLVTAGPTIEDIDCVRFLSNRSTGRMGVAIAQAAARRGARVLLVHGPLQTRIPDNEGIESHPVRSAFEMHTAVMELIVECKTAIFAAAVADFTPASRFAGKIKKGALPDSLRLNLEPTPDILSGAGRLVNPPFLVGFAAEADDVELNAMNKMQSKNCDMICANMISAPGRGFAGSENELIIFHRDGRRVDVPLQNKLDCAHEIIDQIRMAAG